MNGNVMRVREWALVAALVGLTVWAFIPPESKGMRDVARFGAIIGTAVFTVLTIFV